MTEFSIIGLTGRAGSGKDTVAEILKEAFGHVPVAFAAALREEVAGAFGVDIRNLLHRSIKETPTGSLSIYKSKDRRFIEVMECCNLDLHCPRSPRQILQLWGTEYRRTMDSPDYWTDKLSEKIESLFRSGVKRIAITDVRFSNEAAFVKSCSGELWRIVRDNDAHASALMHESELWHKQIAVDRTIYNNKSLGSLVCDVLLKADEPINLENENGSV